MKHPRNRIVALPLLLAGLLPLAAHAGASSEPGVAAELAEARNEVRRELAEARKEVRRELAQARTELEQGNLELGNSINFGKSGKRTRTGALPKAEITPQGDFLIDGKAVAINAAQRSELLAYRGLVIDLAKAGIDLGERGAQIALEAVDRGLFSLVFAAMTGSLERNIERTVKEAIEPGLVQICSGLPALLASQQRLSASLPQFSPYATLEAEDVANCADDMRREFASN